MKCMHMISRGGDHSEGWGVGVNLDLFQKFIRFGSGTLPLLLMNNSWLSHLIQISIALPGSHKKSI